jgi:cytochrome c-type biogenesis protein CcmH/NrfG
MKTAWLALVVVLLAAGVSYLALGHYEAAAAKQKAARFNGKYIR